MERFSHTSSSVSGRSTAAVAEDAEEFGFVDEEVVKALIDVRRQSRSLVAPADRVAPASSGLVLSSEEEDFAGWFAAPSNSPFYGMTGEAEVREPVKEQLFPRRAAPPELAGARVGSVHQEARHGWLFAIAGMLSVLCLLGLLVLLSQRPVAPGEQAGGLAEALQSLLHALPKPADGSE